MPNWQRCPRGNTGAERLASCRRPTGGFSSRVAAHSSVAGQWPDASGGLPRPTLLGTAEGTTECCEGKGGRLQKQLFTFHIFGCTSSSQRKPSFHMVSLLFPHTTNRLHTLEAPGTKAGDLPSLPTPPTLFSHNVAFILFSSYVQ